MIGALGEMQRGPAAEILHDRLEQAQFRQRIARALQEQHRYLYICEVLRPIRRRLSRRMQGKTEKGEPLDAVERRLGLRLRSHPPAKGLSAGDQRQSRAG